MYIYSEQAACPYRRPAGRRGTAACPYRRPPAPRQRKRCRERRPPLNLIYHLNLINTKTKRRKATGDMTLQARCADATKTPQGSHNGWPTDSQSALHTSNTRASKQRCTQIRHRSAVVQIGKMQVGTTGLQPHM